MKQNDFISCKFENDTKNQYVAQITKVYADSFECRFVHSGSVYSFFTNTWTVNSSAGGKFPPGTRLTQHDIYTICPDCSVKQMCFIAVTFKDQKQYLGILQNSGTPSYLIVFLHGSVYPTASIYEIGNDYTIKSASDGKYPVGEKIIGISVYQHDIVAPTATTTATPVNMEKTDQQMSEDVGFIFANAGKEYAVDDSRIQSILEAAKFDNNTNPELSSEARSELKTNAKDDFAAGVTRMMLAITKAGDSIKEELKKEEELREFWLDIAFGFLIPNAVSGGVKKGLEAIKLSKDTVETLVKNSEILFSEAVKYPAIKRAFLESEDPNGLGYLSLLNKALQKYQSYFSKTFNLMDNRKLASISGVFGQILEEDYETAILKVVSDYKNQVWLIDESDPGTFSSSYYYLRLRKDPKTTSDYWLIVLEKIIAPIIGDEFGRTNDSYAEHAYVTKRYADLAKQKAKIPYVYDIPLINNEYISSFLPSAPADAEKYFALTWS